MRREPPTATAATAPAVEVPLAGFAYPANAPGARRYRDPESYSARLPFRLRGWNVAPPFYHATGAYIRRILGGRRSDHGTIARAYLRARRRALRVLGERCRKYSATYGEDGALIAGGFRANWPTAAQDSVRDAARRATCYCDAAFAHWRAAGKLARTFRREIGAD